MPRHYTGEDAIQAAVMAHLRAAAVPAFHCPNETKGPVQWLSKRHAMGVETGVPDVLIVAPPPAFPQYHGAALELKDGKRKPTEEQLRWLAVFMHGGWLVAVEHSERAALVRLVAWGYLAPGVIDLARCTLSQSAPSSIASPTRSASARRRTR